MGCILTYKGQDFNSQDELKAYMQQEIDNLPSISQPRDFKKMVGYYELEQTVDKDSIIRNIVNIKTGIGIQMDSRKFSGKTFYSRIQKKDTVSNGEWKKLSNLSEPEYIKLVVGDNDPSSLFGDDSPLLGNAMLQTEDGSKISPATMKKVKTFLQRIGVKLENVGDIVVNGQKLDANALADRLRSLIQISEGKEDVAITEEAMHFAVEIIEQTNPELFKKLLNGISSYSIYNSVLNDPIYRKQYATKDGGIDVMLMKKEAIGKVLSETFIRREEGITEKPELLARAKGWMDIIKEFFKKLFGKAGFNPFEEAADIINKPDVKNVDYDVLAKEIMDIKADGIFAEIFRNTVESGDAKGAISMYAQQLEDPATFQGTVDMFLGGNKELGERILALSKGQLQTNSSVYDKIVSIHNKITLKQDTLTGNSSYIINGKPIAKRVTDMAKAFYEKAFKGRKMSESETQIANNELKRDKGTQGHADMESLFHKYIDDNGDKRDVPLGMPLGQMLPGNEDVMNKLDNYMSSLLDSYPEGTKFLAEVRIYDAVKDEAGTVDFLAILPDGKTDIRDWKFMDINPSAKDVPWYKKEAFNIQIGEYKRILGSQYGIKEFRQTRAIPILTEYRYTDANKTKLGLMGIAIGSTNVKEIQDIRLLPVGTKDESTGNEEIDKLIKQLNALYNKITKEKVVEGRRDLKREKLMQLEIAIRTLQIKGEVKDLLKSAASIISSSENSIKASTKRVEENATAPLSREEENKIAASLMENQSILEFYRDLVNTFYEIPLEESDRKELDLMSQRAGIAINSSNRIKGRVANIIARGYGIKDLLKPERTVKALQRNFLSLSSARTKATQTMWRIVEGIQDAVNKEHSEEAKTLDEIRNKLTEYAKSKGKKAEDIIHKLIHYNNGKRTNQLISKYAKQFYDELRKNLKELNPTWVKDNVDMDKYEEWYVKQLNKKILSEQSQTYIYTNDEMNKEEQNDRIEKWKIQYSPIDINPGNDQLYRFPREDKWLSAEYKEVESIPALLELYNYWQTQLEESHKLGMLEDRAYKRFLPNVRKSMMERITDGKENNGKRETLEYLNGLRADDKEDVAKDPFTGEATDVLTAKFLRDLSKQKINPDTQELYRDYSNTSDDLFRIMGMWAEEKAKFKYLSQVESQLKLFSDIERSKKAVIISRKGEHTETDNNVNADYFDIYMNHLLYNRKYTDKFDGTIKMAINKQIGRINDVIEKVTGHRPVPKNDEDVIDLSVTKGLEAMNRWMQMKVLGLSVVSPLSNLVGGTMNAFIQAGRFFDKKELAANITLLGSSQFNTEQGKKAAGFVEYFIPLTEDEKREKSKALSVKGAVANMGSDWLWYLQRKSDRFVQLPVFWSFLQNTMVENGELVNIREFARKVNDHDNMYQLSETDRRIVEDKINQDIQEFKKRNLFVISKIVNDEIEIPGIDRNSPTVAKFTNRVKQFSKDILGNMDPQDAYQYRMNILVSSVMMFKNWIPRMLKQRFGSLAYEVGKDDWEWGRVNMATTAMLSNLWNTSKDFLALNSGKEGLINNAKIVYEQKRAEIGEDFMSEGAFVDMYVAANRQLLREMLMMCSLVGLFFAAKAAVPPDDDQLKKGAHKYITRLLDRFYGELGFFYDPTSAQSIAGGSIFPAFDTVIQLERFSKNALKDTYYGITNDKKGMDKTKTSKYLFRALPITKELVGYIGIFNDDLAKEYGVQVPLQARPSR